MPSLLLGSLAAAPEEATTLEVSNVAWWRP
jgi:hypothetical protein